MLVEYDLRTRSPVGVVCKKLGGRTPVLVDLTGRPAEGAAAAAVELRGGEGGAEPERISRNVKGQFFQARRRPGGRLRPRARLRGAGRCATHGRRCGPAPAWAGVSEEQVPKMDGGEGGGRG